MFGFHSIRKSLKTSDVSKASRAILSLFTAVAVVSACKPLVENPEAGNVSSVPDNDQDALERLTAKQNTTLKTYMLQSTTLGNGEICPVPEGTQIVADAIKPEGVGHWRVYSVSEIRLPTGEVGRLARDSNEIGQGSISPTATPSPSPTPTSDSSSSGTGQLIPNTILPPADKTPAPGAGTAAGEITPTVVSKTPQELLNCPLLAQESFLVFGAHFSRETIVDSEKKPQRPGTGGGQPGGDGNASSNESWQWPTRGRTIRNDSGGSGYFNAPRASGRGHQGIDIVAAVGEAVYATRSGTIVDPAWEGAYGKVVDVQHAGGYLSRYAHLSSFTYSHGTYVEKGARIAAAGRTGNAASPGITPHLHFEIRRGGRVVNPRALLP